MKFGDQIKFLMALGYLLGVLLTHQPQLEYLGRGAHQIVEKAAEARAMTRARDR